MTVRDARRAYESFLGVWGDDDFPDFPVWDDAAGTPLRLMLELAETHPYGTGHRGETTMVIERAQFWDFTAAHTFVTAVVADAPVYELAVTVSGTGKPGRPNIGVSIVVKEEHRR